MKTEREAHFDQAAGNLPETDFTAYLQKSFGHAAACHVMEMFEALSLPPPQSKREFIEGFEGALVFLNPYGVVLRIEPAVSAYRMNDNPWILQPLATIEAGNAVIEICPGCHMEKAGAAADYLVEQLRLQKVDFWDSGVRNIGRLPVRPPGFPEGVPIVVDRLAVMELSEGVGSALKSLGRKILKRPAPEMKITPDAVDAAAAQESLYAPLRAAFERTWPDPRQMKQFWALCQRAVQEKKLVAGWNEIDRTNLRSDQMKPLQASFTAEAYEARLNATPSTAAAVPQSPHRRV